MREKNQWIWKSICVLGLSFCLQWSACESSPQATSHDASTIDFTRLDGVLHLEKNGKESADSKPDLPILCKTAADCSHQVCDQKNCGDGCSCQKSKAKEMHCTDGKDNDSDLKKDCQDSDCDGQSCGKGCLCQNLKKTETHCTDGIDNDGDGKTDCEDDDCKGQSCGEQCVCESGYKKELNCSDGIDNDGDGKVDCEDSDCAGKQCGKNCACYGGNKVSCSEKQLTTLFKSRIEPLIQKNTPSSCNQCHLSGVNLSLFVQDTPCRSMACMKERGLVNFDAPENSKILKSILRSSPKSTLITKKVQQKEYQGFLDWITFSAACQSLVCGKIPNACGKGGEPTTPSQTLPMLGGCNEKDLVKSFRALIAPERGRCVHCHASNSGHPQAPGFFDPKDDWAGDRRTMYNIIGIKAVNLKDPAQSRLILKPLAITEGGIKHGGGDKLQNKEEKTYKDYLQWLQQYASCASQKKTP